MPHAIPVHTLQQKTQNMKRKRVPPDPDGMNGDRALWAQVAIDAFGSACKTDPEDLLKDLLCDLRHWADRNGRDFDSDMFTSRLNYEAETWQ